MLYLSIMKYKNTSVGGPSQPSAQGQGVTISLDSNSANNWKLWLAVILYKESLRRSRAGERGLQLVKKSWWIWMKRVHGKMFWTEGSWWGALLHTSVGAWAGGPDQSVHCSVCQHSKFILTLYLNHFLTRILEWSTDSLI